MRLYWSFQSCWRRGPGVMPASPSGADAGLPLAESDGSESIGTAAAAVLAGDAGSGNAPGPRARFALLRRMGSVRGLACESVGRSGELTRGAGRSC